MTHDTPTLSTVGHDGGRLVLRLERVVGRSPDEVRRALAAPGHRRIPCDVPTVSGWASDAGAVRWEADPAGDATLLALTAWIDDTDVEAAAHASAGYQACFEQFARLLDTGATPAALRCPLLARLPRLADLATQYASAVAAALADTD